MVNDSNTDISPIHVLNCICETFGRAIVKSNKTVANMMKFLKAVSIKVKEVIKFLFSKPDESIKVKYKLTFSIPSNSDVDFIYESIPRAPPILSIRYKIELWFFLHKEELHDLGTSLFWFILSSKGWDILHILFDF